MPTTDVYNLKGINTKIQPFDQADGQIIHCVNMYTDLIGAKRKRPGYVTFNGTADGSAVTSLFQYQKGDGTTNYLYRASGSSLYYYNEGAGTGDWTLATNGTISPGARVGHTTFDDVLIVGDGVGSTRHTTDGVTFTDSSLAPIGQYLTNEFGRVFIAGTASDVFYSSANEGTNWQTTGTSDSSSIRVSGAGRLNGIFSSNDRVVMNKTSGVMKRWDDFSLTTVPTSKGYSSPDSVLDIDGYNIGLNRLGLFGYGGGRPEILSNPVEKHIYNNDSTGIAGSVFTNAPAGVNKYQYMLSVGTVTDEYTRIQIPNCVMCYNYQLDEWTDYQYANRPSAFTTYIDSDGNEQTIFGDSTGQVYQLAGTATTDNGVPIACSIIGFIHLDTPDKQKIFNKIEAFANPGCEASLMLAGAKTFDLTNLNWVNYGSLKSGVLSVRKDIRGNFLFYKVIESSTTTPFQFYGFTIDYDFQGD